MSVSYLTRNGSGYTPNPTDWSSVVAVRVDLTLFGQSVDGRDLVRTTSNIVSLRSADL